MKPSQRKHVVIAGVTTRPFAASAARAGFRVTAVDSFGDRDLREIATVILARAEPGQSYGPVQAADAAAAVPAELATYTSNFENYPAAVVRLSQRRRLLGNSAGVLTRIRNPIELMRAVRRAGLPSPVTRSRPPEPGSHRMFWLLKPRRSGGGHGITRWSPGQPVPRDMYLQQHIGGAPGSVAFAADGSGAVILGFSRQLVGEADFGVRQYRYCGSLVSTSNTVLFPCQTELLHRAGEIAGILAREFGLVGLNGMDFIARNGVPYPTEVNPRYSSSMELIERSTGSSMFEIHVRACEGTLPRELPAGSRVHGKAIVFARRDVEVGSRLGVLAEPWIADLPHAGERILRGRPICTVFAEAQDPVRCRQLLGHRAAAVYRSLKPRVGRAA